MGVRTTAKDRRGIARTRRRVPVRYSDGKRRHMGYTTDLGDRGLFLQGNFLFPAGTLVELQIEPEGECRTIRGVVRWVKEARPLHAVPRDSKSTIREPNSTSREPNSAARSGMGIEILAEGATE